MVKWNGSRQSDRPNREKWSTSKGGLIFSKLFRLDRTDPFSFRPKFLEILVEWIAPPLCSLLTSIFNFVPCGRVVQKAYCLALRQLLETLWKSLERAPKSSENHQKSHYQYTYVKIRIIFNPLTPGSKCPRPTPDFLAFFVIFQSERKHKNKPYAQ